MADPAKEKQRKKGRVVLIILLSVLAVLLAAAAIYFYKCTHYWQPSYRATEKAGFIEKDATVFSD